MENSVAEVIARYSPVGIPPAAAVFARQVTARAVPHNTARAKTWLYAAGRVAFFAVSVGLDLDAGVVLPAGVIERFVLQMGPAVPVSTRRTIRSALRTLEKRTPDRTGFGLGQQTYADDKAYCDCTQCQTDC